MTRIARLVILVVLALAVPFHAAYAVAMSQCAARVHDSEHSMSHRAQSAHDAQVPCEHAAVDAAVSDPEEKSTGVTGSHCGACSTCGTSIAIAGDALPPLAMARKFSPLLLPEARLDGVTPGRLDRPPLPL